MVEEKKTLSKKAIRKAYLDWMFFNLSVQNFERMEGPAIVKMLADVREEIYPNDKEAQKEMLERHTIFFNTEPNLGSIVPGIVLGMEYEMAQGGDVQPEFINSIKTALMGPFAGIGDSLLPGTLCPILLSIALGMCENGEIIGPIFYIISFLAIMLPLTWFLFSYGVKTGANAAELVLSGGIKDKVTKAAETVGLIVIGAVTASYTHVNIGLVYMSGDLSIDIAAILDSLMPGLSVLLMSFLAYVLMVKRKWSINKMMAFFLIVAVLGYFTTILKV
ncbi:PTS system mannose/fructose/sorbose family transporter subunit IID [Thomasclavelia ramosa]|uniref:PTS system mannose/fructose/sorbose family transporter subunit IID n=1 Tax=Thomasclavelia ramosa TaxID=1547 RepID=UPI001D07181A|nr:PTS system mannose/fructose/sorbose family transporter subunit IID [Thomasclavelia ramosa]MCB6437412.1 PTS system mannose/fructose/sorbose family transporter subunit IID [Thomasclavelia ramosa]MCB6460462.1 PTS system mannose/fructose/sorbose family transporter subunit IID [Thomasclavelia ramosa]MCB6598816.1 PTS system mannose/fructose/sorbose family transporter subunit IID [Thomasclavelia ramosa]MCB6601085.1 PTS system mannose/fructose/sorbose family transporter subunit IID [Thomasclavelia r